MSNVRNLQKSERSGIGTDDLNIPSYEHYNEMLFLLGDDEPRPGISTIDLDSQMDTNKKTPTNHSKKNKNNKSPTNIDLNEVIKKALKVLDDDSHPGSHPESNIVPDYITGFIRIIENNFRRINPEEVDDAFLEVTGVLSKFLKR